MLLQSNQSFKEKYHNNVKEFGSTAMRLVIIQQILK